MFPNCFPTDRGAAMEFTTRSVRDLQLARGAKEAIFFDDDVPGFGIRLREGGSRTWIFQYRILAASSAACRLDRPTRLP